MCNDCNRAPARWPALLASVLVSAIGSALVAYLAFLGHLCACLLAPAWLLVMVAIWGGHHDDDE